MVRFDYLLRFFSPPRIIIHLEAGRISMIRILDLVNIDEKWWKSNVSGVVLYMNPWTLDEILDARKKKRTRILFSSKLHSKHRIATNRFERLISSFFFSLSRCTRGTVCSSLVSQVKTHANIFAYKIVKSEITILRQPRIKLKKRHVSSDMYHYTCICACMRVRACVSICTRDTGKERTISVWESERTKNREQM